MEPIRENSRFRWDVPKEGRVNPRRRGQLGLARPGGEGRAVVGAVPSILETVKKPRNENVLLDRPTGSNLGIGLDCRCMVGEQYCTWFDWTGDTQIRLY
jgi:hypothetical protein